MPSPSLTAQDLAYIGRRLFDHEPLAPFTDCDPRARSILIKARFDFLHVLARKVGCAAVFTAALNGILKDTLGALVQEADGLTELLKSASLAQVRTLHMN